MSKEKQIDCYNCLHYSACLWNGEYTPTPCRLYEDKTEWSKQSEGEWVTSDIPQEKYVCSVCGGACWYYDYQGEVAKSKYCPHCGAKMKGEANEQREAD